MDDEEKKRLLNDQNRQPNSTKAKHDQSFKGLNYVDKQLGPQALLGKEANVQIVDQDLSSMRQIQRFKGGNCLGQQSAQQQAKSSSTSVPEQPGPLLSHGGGQRVQRPPERMALLCPVEDCQREAQDLSKMELISGGPNFEQVLKGAIKESYVYSDAMKLQGYSGKAIRPNNAGTGDKLRKDWAPGTVRQLSFGEKLASCCEAVWQGCVRLVNFRHPGG